MTKIRRQVGITAASLLAFAGLAHAQAFSENFDDTTQLPGRGWYEQNNSVPGLIGYFQGNLDVFGPQGSAGYLGVNYNSTSGLNTISNWMVAPNATLHNGDTFSFWTRTVSTPAYPDRLQIRMSTNGGSTNVGVSATDVGDFTNLLLDINPTYTTAGYPTDWTHYTVTLSGLPAGGVSGRLAFRYFVENAGPSGSNSDYIGIDSVDYVPAGTPTGACCLADGTCFVGTAAACTAASGVYHGNGVTCVAANCPQPATGACCLDSGCQVLTQAQCLAQGGTYQGDNVTCAVANCPVNLITNGGFETGDFTAWTQFGDTSFSGVANDGVFAHSGIFDAFFGPLDPGGIQQTVTAAAGQQLTIDFWLQTFGTQNTFSADIGGTNLVSLTNEEHQDWTHFTFTVNAPSANPVLTFTFTNPPSYSYLDDVHVYGAGTPAGCYANCDHSTTSPILNVNDFICFQSKFAAGDTYANCDHSTTAPVLNVNDFICFQTQFASGCTAP